VTLSNADAAESVGPNALAGSVLKIRDEALPAFRPAARANAPIISRRLGSAVTSCG